MSKPLDANGLHASHGIDALRAAFDAGLTSAALPELMSGERAPLVGSNSTSPRSRNFCSDGSRATPSASGCSSLVLSAAALQGMSFPPIRYVVQGYIAEGCTLLAGRPKLGKSWFMLDVGLAVAAGRYVLGDIQCEQGDVLYLALEDNRRRMRKRIEKLLGTKLDWPAAFQFATEWPRADDGGLERIRAWLEAAANPRLIVVDVLARFKPAMVGGKPLYEADYDAIVGLQALASEYEVAIVVVHHTRKGGSDNDPFEKVSGTLGLSGAADATMVLDRDGSGATLYARGRDVEEIEAAVDFDRVSCRWRVLGEAAEVRRTDERAVILDALREAEEPMTPTEIAGATGQKGNNVKQLLFKMYRDGEVTKNERGRYVHPSRSGDNPPDPDNCDNQITDADGEEPGTALL